MESSNIQHYQQQVHHQHQGQQLHQEGGSTTTHRCKECGLFLNSAESLEVHLQYHKENLMSKWGTQAPRPNVEETNNNMKSIKREFLPTNNSVPAVPENVEATMNNSPEYNNRSPPENNPGFTQPPTPQSYHSESSPYQNAENSSFSPGFQNYQQIKQEQLSPIHQYSSQGFYSENFYIDNNAQGPSMQYDYPPLTHKISAQNTPSFRYHPYQSYERTPQATQVTPSSPSYLHQPTPSPSPKQCDKCGFVCESAAQMTEHISVSHPVTSSHITAFQHNFMFSGGEVKVEEEQQSEILDLDSHKVHQVYSEDEKRQNGEMVNHTQHSVTTMLNPWPPGHQAQNSPSKMFPHDNRMFLTEQKIFANGMQDKMFEQKLFQQHQAQSDFVPNGLATPTQDNGMNPQPFRLYDVPAQPSTAIVSPNQVPVGPAQPTPPPSSKGTNWKSNEARRPKTYNCTACNKWFTSSGHLKRHYNTTLHKNAVKSSGQPDPATLPISAHHHPAREQNNRGDDQSSNSPREESRTEVLPETFDRSAGLQGMLQQPPNGSYDRPPGPNLHHAMNLHHSTALPNVPGSPPNGEAGPSATNLNSRGLLTLSTTPNTSNMLTSNTSSGFIPPPMMMPMDSPQFQLYPNGDAPHVTQVTTINNHSTTGESLMHQYEHETLDSVTSESNGIQPLPSFSQIQTRALTFMIDPYGNANVGGMGPATAPFSYGYDNQIYEVVEASGPPSTNSSYPQHGRNHNNNIVLMAANTDGEMFYEVAVPSPEDHISNIKANSTQISPQNNQITSTVPASKTQGPHKCFDCDKYFNKSCYLTQHNKTFHSGEKPFKCARCGKRFQCEKQHENHLGKHSGDKPHKCLECPKAFNHKTDLRRHECLHTGSKPYACQTCGKGFIRKDHMLKHCETHLRKPVAKNNGASNGVR